MPEFWRDRMWRELLDFLWDNDGQKISGRPGCQSVTASYLVHFQFSDTREDACRAPATCDYEEWREIPSLFILKWRVDLFIPSFEAAPFGPATIQFDCFRALRIC